MLVDNLGTAEEFERRLRPEVVEVVKQNTIAAELPSGLRRNLVSTT
jgi:hypothetical protein